MTLVYITTKHVMCRSMYLYTSLC